MTISPVDLRAGQLIRVRGRITYSRLAAVIDGDELAEVIAQAKARVLLHPTPVPYTSISLVNAEILSADPKTMTLEEQYVQQRVRVISRGQNTGKNGLRVINKGRRLPKIYAIDPSGMDGLSPIKLERDLANGLDVTLVLKTFTSGSYTARGLSLRQVHLNEAPRYATV